MAAWWCARGAGRGASRPWVPARRPMLLLVLLLLRGSGYKEDKTKPDCGQPRWSEDKGETRHWPWEVSLQTEKAHVCGGALIDHLWAVTAAHCIQGTKEYSVVLGTSQLHPKSPTAALTVPVRDIVLYPKYWGQTYFMGDIALLRLLTPVPTSKFVQPICLPEPTFTLPVGTQCWVTGWGQARQRFAANSTLAPGLQEAEVFIMDSRQCDRIYHKQAFFPRVGRLVLGDMVCATNYGENSCHGDSGGPLVCEVEGRWLLAGVLSWEKACTGAQNPGVYTRVTKYTQWIRKQISRGVPSTSHGSFQLAAPSWLLLPTFLLLPSLC